MAVGRDRDRCASLVLIAVLVLGSAGSALAYEKDVSWDWGADPARGASWVCRLWTDPARPSVVESGRGLGGG